MTATQQADPLPKAQRWWINGAFVVAMHVIGAASLVLYRPTWQTLLLTWVVWVLATLGITTGYHRLWSHRSFEATTGMRIMLAFMGTLGFQGSIKWWVTRHRLHHRFTETEDDPYSATKGFWFSHMGWIFNKPFYKKMKLIDTKDLDSDPVVAFQHKHFPLLAFSSSFLLPTLIASLWSDGMGGYLYAGVICRLAIWHCTFLINSLAHWAGSQDYSSSITARGGLLLALLTQGEGYHNFHHEFPKDYRNGIRFFDWDPTKWFIWTCSKLGLVSNLYEAPMNEINKARVETMKERLGIKYPSPPSSLPEYTMSEYKQMESVLLIDGYILDISEFGRHHPGGAEMLQKYIGRDASKAFHGGLNMHSESAKRWMEMLRIGRIAGYPVGDTRVDEKMDKWE